MAEEAFKQHEVVKDILGGKSPAGLAELNVCYNKEDVVKMGNELTPARTQDAPNVVWQAEGGAHYTLIMTDPDAPSRQNPKFREWRHWVVVNIPGVKVDQGDVLAKYMGPGPPKGTGLHRYVFLLYKQKGLERITDSGCGDSNRGGWHALQFVNKHGLGEPVAGCFFQAQQK